VERDPRYTGLPSKREGAETPTGVLGAPLTGWWMLGGALREWLPEGRAPKMEEAAMAIPFGGSCRAKTPELGRAPVSEHTQVVIAAKAGWRTIEELVESLILAQDQRWRRA
jgi:hypothetical protein